MKKYRFSRVAKYDYYEVPARNEEEALKKLKKNPAKFYEQEYYVKDMNDVECIEEIEEEDEP